MKKLLIGLLVLGSASSFAKTNVLTCIPSNGSKYPEFKVHIENEGAIKKVVQINKDINLETVFIKETKMEDTRVDEKSFYILYRDQKFVKNGKPRRKNKAVIEGQSTLIIEKSILRVENDLVGSMRFKHLIWEDSYHCSNQI